MAIDPDDTIRLRPVLPAAAATRRQLTAFLVALAVCGFSAVAYLVWPFPTPPAAVRPLPPPTAAVFATLDEGDFAAFLPTAPTMVRLRANPLIFVLVFPDLETQAATLNRLAALVEKAGLPRDRVVTQAELAAALERSGEVAATWYLGHDYRGADVARFFRLAAAGGVQLTAGEQWLAARFAEARAAVAADSEIALISIANPDHRLDREARAAILHHEIGHGQFFTRPEFAARIRAVWTERFDAEARAAFTAFLGREGYDTTNVELLANETMAYLLFTPDPRLFAPRHVGLSAEAVERLRRLMREAAPLP